MKCWKLNSVAVLVLAGVVAVLGGCGSSGGANVVVDTVSPPGAIVVADTTTVFTSTVTGSTNLNSTWSCSYTYIPNSTSSNPKPTTQTVNNCNSGDKMQGGTGTIGTWITDQTTSNNTLTYTAPTLANFPNPIPTISFTAAAAANTSKKGTAVVALDTGIRLAITPPSATAPVGITPAQQIAFQPQIANAAPLGVMWQVMQPVAGSSTAICKAFPSLVNGGACGTANPMGQTCSPGCGTIDPNTGVFTAPASLPTNTSPIATTGSSTVISAAALTVTVVAWLPADINHYALATITLVNASTNPLTFTGLHPTTIAAGGALQDIWLDAHNILNTTVIAFTPPGANQTPQTINPTSIYTIPTTLNYCTPDTTSTPPVTCDASILTRIRLTAAQLANAGVGTVTVRGLPGTPTVGPGCTGVPSSSVSNTTDISCPVNLVYASPVATASVPDSYSQGTQGAFSVDGGFFGSTGNPFVALLFNGSITTQNPSVNTRQLSGPLPSINTPGLYPAAVSWTATLPPGFTPPSYLTSTTGVAVQPTFISNPPAQGAMSPIAFPAAPGGPNVVPSSIAVNSAKGYAVVTEQGTNTVQIINIVHSGLRYVAQMSGGPIAVGNQPTGVAIDDQIDLSGAGYPGQDLGVIVNSADSTLTLMALPSGSIIGSPVSLANLIQEPSGTSAPLPYSIGVDPGTHYAAVAFSNATLGFIVDVNPNPVPAGVTPPSCFLSSQKIPCAIASVSLNTGANPQVVMQPGAPLAYVTPGGAGVTSVVNLLLTNNSVSIAPAPNGASCTNGIATITTPTPNGLNPSFPGAVLVQGVTPSTPVNFNGTFNVLSATTYTFTYALSCTTNVTAGSGSVTFGNPYYTFSTTATAVGGAINPVTRNFAFADPNASSAAPQIAFIRSLDQTVTSLFLTVGSCDNGCTNQNPTGAPETGMRYVAWDPYVNLLIGYNPGNNFNTISLINPGGPTANGLSSPSRLIPAIPTGQTGLGSFTPSGAGSATNVYGPMAYDPRSNLVLVANAGSNNLSYFDLDPQSTFKKVEMRDFQVTQGGVASGQPPLASAPGAPNPLPVAKCDPTNPTNPYAACFAGAVTVGQQASISIFGQGFGAAGSGCNQTNGPVQVRLDEDAATITCTVKGDGEVDAVIPASRLTVPHTFALDVVAGGVNSNTNYLYAVGIIDLSKNCSNADMPEAVAYDDERNVAVVTNYGCNNMSLVNLDVANTHNYGVPYGGVMSTVSTGNNPLGVGVIPRLGLAVVANNADSSASIVDMSNPLSPKEMSFTSVSCTISSGTTNSTNICVGVSPTGVAIDQDRALAIIANTGGNSISSIDLTPLLQTNSGDCATNTSCVPQNQLVATSGPPVAIAIDPNRAVAVVTNTQNTGTTSVSGGLDVINLATTPPSKNTTASIGSITANPTGIAFDPVPNPALFYITSTQQNAIYSFNPDTSGTQQIRVGVNPYSIAYNYQTGTMLSVNSTSNTSSVIDAVNAPVFSTRYTLGISSQSRFASTIDNFTNTAIVADQNNNRVLILPLPQ